MVSINVSDQLGIIDSLSVVISEPAPQLTDKAAIIDAIVVSKFTQPQIPVQGTAINTNPSFAGGSSTGWGTVGGSFTVSGSPPAGSPQAFAADFSSTASGDYLTQTTAPFTLIPNTSPVMTPWVYSSTGLAVIGFDWLNSGGGLISSTTQTFNVPINTWVQLAFAANPPWASSPVKARPRLGPGAATSTLWTTQVTVTFEAPLATAPSPAVFVKSLMPVMHVQNLVTGQWYHRNVQGITQPTVTWNLNAADTFTCTISPPRADLLDSTGNPLLQEWRDACYLEEDNAIKFGGILTSSSIQGPNWQMGFTGFAGYPNGLIYEGANYTKTSVESLDVVRYLWNWVQTQISNIGMVVTTNKETGVLLGAQLPSVPLSDKLNKASKQGDTVLHIAHPDPWAAGDVIRVGNEGTAYTIKSISGHDFTLTAKLKGASSRYVVNAVVTQVLTPTPFSLFWYNGTDIGQEIESIRQEAVFDWRERHEWSDSSKATARHFWNVYVPRAGTRRTDLRFCEGENIIQAAQVTRDGSVYADRVVGLGFGSGSSTVRANVSDNSGRLGRQFVYTNQTATTVARATVLARAELASRLNIDAVTAITVINHSNAPFGSFFPGDDIAVILCTGWRNTTIWSRITSITQDPTTQLMKLTLARSDSFTYLAESGQAGTL